MKKATLPVKQNFVYPVNTEGSKFAREIRSQCNSLTPKERKALLKQGLRRINQGHGKK